MALSCNLEQFVFRVLGEKGSPCTCSLSASFALGSSAPPALVLRRCGRTRKGLSSWNGLFKQGAASGRGAARLRCVCVATETVAGSENAASGAQVVLFRRALGVSSRAASTHPLPLTFAALLRVVPRSKTRRTLPPHALLLAIPSRGLISTPYLQSSYASSQERGT